MEITATATINYHVILCFVFYVIFFIKAMVMCLIKINNDDDNDE